MFRTCLCLVNSAKTSNRRLQKGYLCPSDAPRSSASSKIDVPPRLGPWRPRGAYNRLTALRLNLPNLANNRQLLPNLIYTSCCLRAFISIVEESGRRPQPPAGRVGDRDGKRKVGEYRSRGKNSRKRTTRHIQSRQEPYASGETKVNLSAFNDE